MKVFLAALLAILASAVPTGAQLLSVDINGAAGGNNTAPGFVAWNLGAQTGNNIKTVTQYFTNYTYAYDPDTGLPTSTNVSLVIPCTVSMTYPATASSTIYLNSKNANKNGYSTSTDPNSGWRLSIDGCMAYWKDDTITVDQPYTNGGALSLTISNLPAGVHTITTYHNDPWGSAGATWHAGANAISRCIVSANGVPVFTNTPSSVSTNDSKCGFAFFSVTNSYDGQPIVLNFDPDHSSSLDFVILNGFEIDRTSAPGTTATAIFPGPGDEHASANNDVPLAGMANAGYLTLQWVPAAFALSNYVYFGTNSSSVQNATVASPEFKSASAAVVGATNSFFVTNLNSALTYYWRVDQLDAANGSTNLVKGTVWMFRTRHLAFPTAEGYGRFARGGRGGVVIEVTNLNDSGPGSYRAAVAASGSRTVVFRVSGLIRLQSPCVIGNGYLTVAGQTAPGEGICLANWRAGMSSCNDVIMRFIRCRLGDASKQAMDGIGLGNANNSIIDHCSISWTIDEASSSRQSGSVGSQSAMNTFQHNIISEPLQHSYHYNDALRASTGCTNCYQAHGFAASISGEIASYHHNLIAHSTDRNWSLAGGLDQSAHYAGSLDIRNNVVYNWIGRTTDGGVQRADYVNNYYKPFPSNPYATWLLRLDPINTNWGTEFYYMTGNVMEGKTYITNNWTIGTAVAVGNGTNNYASSNQVVLCITNAEIFPSYVATQTATNAYKAVLSDVGCNLPVPDVIDTRVVGEVLTGTTHYIGTNGPTYTIDGVPQSGSPNYPGIIDSQTDVHDALGSPNYPWPAYATANAPADTDHDGLPDWWEKIKGLNPNSAVGDFSDSNADPDGDGYSNLEDYLNWLAAIHTDCPANGSVDVELTQFTRGYTNLSPVYTLSAPVNGTINLIGGKTARFTTTVPTNALGSFRFVVTDSQGAALTNMVGVHIVVSNTPPVLAPITDKTVNPGVTLQFTNTASDADVPTNILTFVLATGPTNAVINSSNGVFAWRPWMTQANTTNVFRVVVADNGYPSLSATQAFNVVVNPIQQPTMAAVSAGANAFHFSITGQTGPDLAIQSSTNLQSWTTLLLTNSPTMPFNWTDTNPGSSAMQFYRVKLGPPLP